MFVQSTTFAGAPWAAVVRATGRMTVAAAICTAVTAMAGAEWPLAGIFVGAHMLSGTVSKIGDQAGLGMMA